MPEGEEQNPTTPPEANPTEEPKDEDGEKNPSENDDGNNGDEDGKKNGEEENPSDEDKNDSDDGRYEPDTGKSEGGGEEVFLGYEDTTVEEKQGEFDEEGEFSGGSGNDSGGDNSDKKNENDGSKKDDNDDNNKNPTTPPTVNNPAKTEHELNAERREGGKESGEKIDSKDAKKNKENIKKKIQKKKRDLNKKKKELDIIRLSIIGKITFDITYRSCGICCCSLILPILVFVKIGIALGITDFIIKFLPESNIQIKIYRELKKKIKKLKEEIKSLNQKARRIINIRNIANRFGIKQAK